MTTEKLDLDTIEKRITAGNLDFDDVDALIARVRELEAALEQSKAGLTQGGWQWLR
jgi:hypothetical protein